MNATSLPKVKKALRNVNLEEAQSLLQDVMELEDAAAVHRHLERFLAEHGMEKFIHNPVE